MQRSFFYSTTLLIALASLSIDASIASAQEKAGTRAMRLEGEHRTEKQTEQQTGPQPEPRTEPQPAQTLTISCEPSEVVVASVIRYMLPKTSKVTVRVYDESGREVAVLDNQKRHAGMHQVIFDRRDLPDGLYYCKVEAGGSVATQRLVLVAKPQ